MPVSPENAGVEKVKDKKFSEDDVVLPDDNFEEVEECDEDGIPYL